MGGVLMLGAWIMYNFDEAAAFRKAQEVHDADQATMLPNSEGQQTSSQGQQQDEYHSQDGQDSFTPLVR
jgi:hypothetical protein